MERYIYKITNKINGKIYIGQVSNKSVNERFKRHIREASSDSRSALDRAIFKYVSDNFICEEIDKASSKKELNAKEIYWIDKLNSKDSKIGYNLTNGGDGGNIYINKSDKEMKIIKEKISKANYGKNNGMSKKIRAYSIIQNKEYIFDCINRAIEFFHIKHKGIITDRCTNKNHWYYKNEWNFAFDNEPYLPKEIRTWGCGFDTYWKRKCNESVSTIPDECKGVEVETSTTSKRQTTINNIVEDIVSADGDIG